MIAIKLDKMTFDQNKSLIYILWNFFNEINVIFPITSEYPYIIGNNPKEIDNSVIHKMNYLNFSKKYCISEHHYGCDFNQNVHKILTKIKKIKDDRSQLSVQQLLKLW